MKIQLSKPKTKKIHVEEDAYDGRMASAHEYNNYQKKVMKDPSKSAELMIEFLGELGLPDKLLWKMTFEQLNKLVTYLTLGEVSEGK
tara:strand:- start:2000 stop:2260 length:261 start_codon:yes stop_codon:yes gene_type:complete